MSAFRIFLAVTAVALTSLPVAAQNAVQLPTLSSFRTNTTVSVPDRGSVYTGGINRAADGRNEFGTPLLPLRNRSIGSQRSASSVWTSVYIHDFEAMDEALLSQARNSAYRSGTRPSTRTVVGTPQPVRPQPAGTWRVRPSFASTDPLSKSVAQLKAEHAAEQAARSDEARSLLERGKLAAAKGKVSVARIYYRQAARRAQGPLQKEILAQMELLDTPTVAQR